MTERSTPRGTPEDYREFVRQMEAAAERNSARNKALAWRRASLEERARTVCGLMDMSAAIIRYTGYRKPPLRYPRLPNTRWVPAPTS